jgi:REP element-mobilizing transposase RayT
MARGIERRNIFQDEGDRKSFVERMVKLVDETKTRILAWALLDNHIHLLIISGPCGLSTFMRRLLTGYAYFFNRKYQRSGHLFQNRYKSIVCEEDSYLLELVRYIHLNPLRSHVVGNLEELDRYPWSGHGVLIGKARHDWQEKEYVLDQFGRGERQSMRAYRKFIEEGKGLGRRPELVGGGLVRSLGGWSKVLSLRNRSEETEHDSRILGGGDFVRAVMRDAEEAIARQVRNRGIKTIEETIRRMCKGSGVSEKELASGNQRRRVSKVRTEIACYLNREIGISMAEIARRLGVGTSAIAMAIKRRISEGEKM